MKTMVKLDNVEVGDFVCPFKTDLNSCYLVLTSETNFCPETIDVEDDDLFRQFAPQSCPLRKDSVVVEGSR